MASLRNRVIRLASLLSIGSPLRVALLDVVTARSYKDYVEDKKSKGEKPLSKEDWERRSGPGRQKKDEKVEERSKKVLKDTDDPTGEWGHGLKPYSELDKGTKKQVDRALDESSNALKKKKKPSRQEVETAIHLVLQEGIDMGQAAHMLSRKLPHGSKAREIAESFANELSK
jgi:hypothetical protein